MKFVTECLLPAGKSNVIQCPNLTKQCQVPGKIMITEKTSEGEEVAISGVLCRIHGGGAEIGNYGEPTFKLSNEINLSPYSGIIEKTGSVTVLLTNRSGDPKRVRVHVDYVESYGGIILEEKIDHFENLLSDIHSKGYCTKLVLTFSQQLESLEFANVAECLEGQESWVQPLNVPIDDDLDLDDQVYVIDFTTPELGSMYSENLNFMELRAHMKPTSGERQPTMYMYVTAYGFPYKR
jgi:hypothetical protein